MKCPNCPQFTSKDTDGDPDVDVSVDANGVVSGSVRIANCCADCGEELEESNFQIDEDFGDDVSEHTTPEGEKCEDGELEVSESTSRTDRTQDKDRHGKPIKSFRYRRRYYGYESDLTVTCSCGASWNRLVSDEVMASGMDCLV